MSVKGKNREEEIVSLVDMKHMVETAELLMKAREEWIAKAAARYAEKGCLKRVGVEAATILLDEAGVSLLSDPVAEADKDMADWVYHR